MEYDKAHAYVYGNVVIQGRKTRNFNMIHWGGDQGYSRSGTLFFVNNTVVGTSEKTLFILTRFSDCKLHLINNVFVGAGLLWNGKGGFEAQQNWVSNMINVPSYKTVGLKGSNPEFAEAYGIPYIPSLISPLVNNGANTGNLKVKYMPKPKGGGLRRPRVGRLDIGAFETGTFWFKRPSTK
jgi:hypothetical protein